MINNDTVVDTYFLEPLLEKFVSNKNAGIVAPEIYYFSNPEKIWSAGGKISIIRGSGFTYSYSLRKRRKLPDKYIEFVSGCCMLIKKDVFQKVDYFDEKFFLYIEDTDLCYRTKQAGFDICVSHDSKILHKIGNSTKNSISLAPLYYSTRNRLYFAKKNFKKIYLATFLYIVLSMSIKGCIWFLIGKYNNIKIVRMSIRDFLKGSFGKSHQFQ